MGRGGVEGDKVETGAFNFLVFCCVLLPIRFRNYSTWETYFFMPSVLVLMFELRLDSETFQTKMFRLKSIENGFYVNPV